MNKYLLISVLFLLSVHTNGQGLFSKSLSDSGSSKNGILDINGYTRGTMYSGWNNDNQFETKSLYSETALKLKANPNSWGKAYADIRFRTGLLNGVENSGLEVREAYAQGFVGKFDFKFGKQVISWGRADAFNPTQSLTPYDYFSRSPLDDDRKLGNIALRAKYNPFDFLSLELDWVPIYKESVYEFELLDFTDYISFSEGHNPANILKNSSIGAKIDLLFNKVEGSVSYFNGYDCMRGLITGQLPMPPFDEGLQIDMLPTPFRQSTLGTDLAVNLGGFGIRAEAAWKMPKEDENNPYVPMEEISWSVGADRGLDNFRLMLEYYGKKCFNFSPLDPPEEFDPAMLDDMANWPLLAGMLSTTMGYYNRVLFDQTHEWIHSLIIRPSVSLFHETLELEASCLYNITTTEYLIRPALNYVLADGVKFTAGYEHYYGPDNSRFSWIKDIFNGPFLELKINF